MKPLHSVTGSKVTNSLLQLINNENIIMTKNKSQLVLLEAMFLVVLPVHEQDHDWFTDVNNNNQSLGFWYQNYQP